MEKSVISHSADQQVHQYQIENEEAVTNAIVKAFENADINEFDDSSVLHDWTEPDALNSLFKYSDGNHQVLIRLWGHLVSITSETIIIYKSEK